MIKTSLMGPFAGIGDSFFQGTLRIITFGIGLSFAKQGSVLGPILAVVLFAIPLSFIGVLLALALTNNSLNIFTILGIIMLIGLVCKNAIMLVDYTNQRRAAGESIRMALIQANHARLRPILMTTIAMVFGMLPIALASGAGAEWKNGLAWVIIGGLLSSLFLTLIVVPVIYEIMEKIIAKFSKGEKIDYEAEMIADYEHKELSEDGFNPKHTV